MVIVLNHIDAMPTVFIDVGEDDFVQVIASELLGLGHGPALLRFGN
jgi:hypothetical protein